MTDDEAPMPLTFRHKARDRELEVAIGNQESIDAITSHVETHIGPVKLVFHEVLSDLVHIDLHWVEPQERRPFHTIVTSGMSDRPMKAPEGAEEFRYAELAVTLPADWPMTQEAWKDERHYWPLRLLKKLARFPHEYETWLWGFQSVGEGDHPEPYAASTRQCAALVVPSPTLPEEFATLTVSPEKTIYFFSIIPVYREELLYRMNKGTDALLDRFDRHEVYDIVDPERLNVCQPPKWRLPWRRG